jgi:hypothetical protein
MRDKSCADASIALKATLQKLQSSGQDAFVLFVDLVKAFDSVNREMLWQLLTKYGLPDDLITLIRKLYTDINIEVRCGKATASFTSRSGVKQGDNLAPVLFLFVIQAAVEYMEKSGRFRNQGSRYRNIGISTKETTRNAISHR